MEAGTRKNSTAEFIRFTEAILGTYGGDGAGFYRFPAWAGMKPNDVSPGHVA